MEFNFSVVFTTTCLFSWMTRKQLFAVEQDLRDTAGDF